MTNPNNAVGTNGALNGRTSVNALNDVLACFDGRGILQGWEPQSGSAMTFTLGGAEGVRDVAIAEDANGNKTTVNNISGQPIEVTIATASTEISRIDAVVAYVNNPANGNANETDNPAAVGLIAVEGGAGVVPTESQIRAAITADGGTGTTAYYVVLATVTVPQNATAVGMPTRGKVLSVLSKVESTGTERAYGVTTAGAQEMVTMTSDATANTLAKRGTGGVMSVGTPTATTHAVTKAYADAKAVITVTDTDPGEGGSLANNNFIAVVES